MRIGILALVLSFVMSGITANAQTNNLYVFKNERKEHLQAAKRARKEAREKAVQNDFYMRVKTLTSMSTAKMIIDMKKSHSAVVRVTDMNGTELAKVFEGLLEKGQHEFIFEPDGNLRKPFVCQLLLDGKTEAMKVVKFNSF